VKGTKRGRINFADMISIGTKSKAHHDQNRADGADESQSDFSIPISQVR
jgi:hypothetical protein